MATPMTDLIRKNGVNAKLRRAIEHERGWRRGNIKTGDPGEWYERWPETAKEIEAALAAPGEPKAAT